MSPLFYTSGCRVSGDSSQLCGCTVCILCIQMNKQQLQAAGNIICRCVFKTLCSSVGTAYGSDASDCFYLRRKTAPKHYLCRKHPQIQVKPSEHIRISAPCVCVCVGDVSQVCDLVFAFGIRDLTSFANVCICAVHGD